MIIKTKVPVQVGEHSKTTNPEQIYQMSFFLKQKFSFAANRNKSESSTELIIISVA